jgi:hypothetical protein
MIRPIYDPVGVGIHFDNRSRGRDPELMSLIPLGSEFTPRKEPPRWPKIFRSQDRDCKSRFLSRLPNHAALRILNEVDEMLDVWIRCCGRSFQ